VAGGEAAINRLPNRENTTFASSLPNLIDEGTEFFELCRLAGFGMDYPEVEDVPCGGIVTGLAGFIGNWTMIVANDSRVKAGTYSPSR